MIKAPWTDEQVRLLAAHQDAINVHPYTCGNDSRHDLLQPTRDGWRCPTCGYTQDWAHDPLPMEALITLSDMPDDYPLAGVRK